MEPTQNTSAYILELADRCVKCGLCLPQCPTYNLTANENESPRGRIALVQGWLDGQLSPSKTLRNHLDQCLLCRRCERICPSKVPYGEIMDQAQSLLNKKPHFSVKKFITYSSINALLSKNISGYLFSVLRLLQKTGVLFLAQKSQLFKLLRAERLVNYLPHLEKKFTPKSFYPSTATQTQGSVALFTGCISNQLDPKTVKASIHLLNLVGYDVHIPMQQVCCGALSLHQGNKTQLLKLANTNIETFNQKENITTVVSLVNGCSSQLQEYSQHETLESFTPEIKDIIEFLSEANWPEEVQFKTLTKTVALQIPCSLQNMLRADDKLMSLLEKIPGIKLPPESIYNRCCGAAGSYFLRNPKFSDTLQKNALKNLTQLTPNIIISSNIGCALQLKAGLAKNNTTIDVLHPVVLLESLLKNK